MEGFIYLIYVFIGFQKKLLLCHCGKWRTLAADLLYVWNQNKYIGILQERTLFKMTTCVLGNNDPKRSPIFCDSSYTACSVQGESHCPLDRVLLSSACNRGVSATAAADWLKAICYKKITLGLIVTDTIKHTLIAGRDTLHRQWITSSWWKNFGDKSIWQDFLIKHTEKFEPKK